MRNNFVGVKKVILKLMINNLIVKNVKKNVKVVQILINVLNVIYQELELIVYVQINILIMMIKYVHHVIIVVMAVLDLKGKCV